MKPAFGWENTLERYKNSYPTKESMGKLKFEFLDLKLISEKYSKFERKMGIDKRKMTILTGCFG